MTASFAALLLLSAFAESNPRTEAPLAWSPSGLWLAYVQAAPNAAAVNHKTGNWLAARTPLPEAQSAGPGPVTWRLWATQIASGRSLLLDESPEPISSPCWNKDGSALAYARLRRTAGTEGRPAWEAIVVRNVISKNIVLREELDASADLGRSGLGGSRAAWSPDSEHIALPTFAHRGLVVLRVATGRIVRSLPGAFEPSWSPKGDKLAYFMAAEDSGVYLLDVRQGTTQILAGLPGAERLPAACWNHDGRRLCVVRLQLQDARRGRSGGLSVDLVELPPFGLPALPIMSLNHQPILQPLDLEWVSLAIDPEGDKACYSTCVKDQPSQLTWGLPKLSETRARFHPIDPILPIACLAIQPSGTRLAMRLGSREAAAPVLIGDLQDQRLTLPMCPDEAARQEWLALLVESARAVAISASHPQDAPAVETAPIFLPMTSSHLPRDPETEDRFKRVSRLALLICERDPGSRMVTDTERSRIDEASAIFHYLSATPENRSPLEKARAALDRLEAGATVMDLDRVSEIELRTRLDTLRVQIEALLGHRDRAHMILEEIRDRSLMPSALLEETVSGTRVTPLQNPADAYLRYLESRLEPRIGSSRDALSADLALPARESLDLTPELDSLLPPDPVKVVPLPEGVVPF